MSDTPKIRPVKLCGRPKFKVLDPDSGYGVAVYADIRRAKVFRSAFEWAIGVGCRPNICVLYAKQLAKDSDRIALETDQPDQHFLPG